MRARCIQGGRGRRPKGERYLYSPAGLTRRLPRDILIVGLHGAGRCGTFLLPSFTRAAAACLRLESSCLFSRKIEQGDANVTQRCSTFRTMLEDCRGLFTASPYPSCQSWYGYRGQFALATARSIDGETARLIGFRSNKTGARRYEAPSGARSSQPKARARGRSWVEDRRRAIRQIRQRGLL